MMQSHRDHDDENDLMMYPEGLDFSLFDDVKGVQQTDIAMDLILGSTSCVICVF